MLDEKGQKRMVQGGADILQGTTQMSIMEI